jgi:hypothetical protein
MASNGRSDKEDEKMVNRTGQAALKPGGLNVPKRSLQSMESSVSQADYAIRDQTCIVFDWDDTLCPSHWIRENRPALQYFAPCPNDPRYKKPLLELSEIVSNVLLLAHEIGHIVILTNAQVNWVETSAKNFMPSVHPLLQQLGCSIVYARARFETDLAGHSPKRPSGQQFEYDYNVNIPQQWKEKAFYGELSKFYSRYAAQSWKNIISVGDQCCERDAVRIASQQRPGNVAKKKCRVKTQKLLEEPSIEDLTAQLHVVQQWLTGIVAYDGDLDVDLSDDDDVIFELHRRLIGDA